MNNLQIELIVRNLNYSNLKNIEKLKDGVIYLKNGHVVKGDNFSYIPLSQKQLETLDNIFN